MQRPGRPAGWRRRWWASDGVAGGLRRGHVEASLRRGPRGCTPTCNSGPTIRRRVLAEGLSKRQACREYSLHWHTLTKILEHPEPPGYRRAGPRRKPKLEPFLPIIHEILKQDQQAPRKQRHTAKRIFDRLQAEHGYDGGYTIIKDAVRAWRKQHAEAYMPLIHRPGEAQVDFGYAYVICSMANRFKVALFVMTLMYSDAVFCCVYPRECSETFLDGHRRAFEFFGGMYPDGSAYDNTRTAIKKIVGPAEAGADT